MKTFTCRVLRLALLVVLLFSITGAFAQCAAPTSLVAGSISGTTAQLSFTPSASAQSYTVTFFAPSTGQSGTVSPNPTGSPVPLSGLTPSTGYVVTVISNCAGGQTASASTSFTTGHPYDEPCTAQPLPLTPANGCTASFSATLNGATETPANGYNQSGCATAQRPTDVWFSFRTAASGPTSTGATIMAEDFIAAPGQVRVFRAASCAGPFTDIGCAVGASGSTSVPPVVVGSLTPNTLYYIRVAMAQDFATQTDFSICVSNPPSCGLPQNLTVASVGATTAALNFLPGPGNTGYQVRLTNLNTGTTSTLTFGTAPPLTLTGLLPATAYSATLLPSCNLFAVGSTVTFTTAPANDEPAAAVLLPLSTTCQPTTGVLDGATITIPNGYANPGCLSGTTADVWYRFTTPASGAGSTGATITAIAAGSTGAVGQLRLFRSAGSGGPFTALACASKPPTGNTVPPLVWAGLAPNTTYYVSVSSNSFGGGGMFSICVTPPPPCPAPILLAATATSNTTATLGWSLPGDTGGSFTVEYGPRGFAPGTGAAGATMVASGSGLGYAATGLTPGLDYDFYVTRACGSTAGSSGRSGPAEFRTPFGGNDDPCGAVALPVTTTCTPTSGTTRGATVTPVNGYVRQSACNTRVQDFPDVWYTFTTAASGQPGAQAVQLTSTGAAELVEVFTATACAGPFTRIGCAGGALTTAAPLLLRGLTPATTYYVAVSSSSNTPGPFSICATPAPPCESPANLAVTSPTGTGATLTFVPAAGATGYTLTLAPASSPATPATITGSPFALTGLTPNTTYTLTLQTTCAGGTGAVVTTSFNSGALAPVNTFCAGAVPIACGQSVSGTTIGSVAAGMPNNLSPCLSGRSGVSYPGVWYRFVGTGDDITLRTCDPRTDLTSRIFVYSGNCVSYSCLINNYYDLACTALQGAATVSFRSTAGTNYLFFIEPSNTVNGMPGNANFVLSVSCTPPPCPAPTNATVGNITGTTANVSFTPSNGGTANSYTATATPTAGGPAVTVIGPASPLTLTGLAANTAYTVGVTAACGSGRSPAATAAFNTLLPTRNAALAAEVGLYPNPAHHAATLALPAALTRQATEVRIVNALGQPVGPAYRIPPARAATETPLDLRGLPAGAYTLCIRTGPTTLFKHLLLE